MAVAMEVVSWREMSSSSSKKRAWGADAHQLMQLMMGAARQPELSTLDLLGKGEEDEFLHLDPEDAAPLPSGWEKCLDLQTGRLYFVNKSSGVSSFDDPRKKRIASESTTRTEIELRTEVAGAPRLAHEFLGSKKSETESMRPSSSKKEFWDRASTATTGGATTACSSPDSNLELDLNLSAGCSPRQQQQQTVCTMEMIQNALKRTPAMKGSRIVRLKSSVSSSFSSLTNSATTTRSSDPSGASPSTSSSSSASSHSGAGFLAPSPTRVFEADSRMKVEEPASSLVMGACTRCLMYVMLNKADPRCPRCHSKVPVEFGAPACKKQRAGGLKLGLNR